MRGKVLLKLDLSVVQNGSTWRIGDGHQVRIRGDKWLPDKHSSRIISPQRNLPSNALVCSFIDENCPRWDEDRVCPEFYPHEARIVLGIPLSSRLPPDKLIWTGTKSGRYSTISAYKLLAEKPSSGPSDPSAHSRFWKFIWALEVPNKIKHFIWRACRESLPTKKNLCTRKLTRNSTCDLCQEGVEDVIHSLWGCPVLKEIWWEEPCLRQQLYTQFVDFRDLCLGVTNIEDQHLAERFAFVAWSIWHTCNASRMKIPCLPYARLYQDSMDRLQEYQAAQTLDEPADSPVLDQEIHQAPTKWRPTCSNIYKANFDGAVFQELQKAGIGVVIRNSNGEVIGILSESYFLPATVEEVETNCMQKGSLLCNKSQLGECGLRRRLRNNHQSPQL